MSVTKRTDHSLSVWSVSPTTVWAIQFGGSGTNDTIVIELSKLLPVHHNICCKAHTHTHIYFQYYDIGD